MLDQPFANIKLDLVSSRMPSLGIETVRGFAELDSTNSWAIRQSAAFADEHLPLLVVCDAQTAGRGRLGRAWHADSGTLTFSILDSSSRTRIAREHLPKLALIVGLAVAEAIDFCIPPFKARIKWPNDVLVTGKKVAGVLIENVPSAVGSGVRSSDFGDVGNHASECPGTSRYVVGVGVNVSTDFCGVTDEIRQRAASLCQISGRSLSLGGVLSEVLQRYRENCEKIGRLSESAESIRQADCASATGFAEIVDAVRERCCLTGQLVSLSHGGKQFAGRCRGLTDVGDLLLETTAGVEVFSSGEVVRIERG